MYLLFSAKAAALKIKGSRENKKIVVRKGDHNKHRTFQSSADTKAEGRRMCVCVCLEEHICSKHLRTPHYVRAFFPDLSRCR